MSACCPARGIPAQHCALELSPELLHGDKGLEGQEELGFFCPRAEIGLSAWGRAEPACSWLEVMGTELVWGSEPFLPRS